jgi:hypothetical protein
LFIYDHELLTDLEVHLLESHALEADVEEFSPVAVEVEGVEMLVVSGIFYVELSEFLEQDRIVSFRGLGIQPKD